MDSQFSLLNATEAFYAVPSSWAAFSSIIWIAYVCRRGWGSMNAWDQRQAVWGILSVVSFLHYLQLDPEFEGWGDVYFFCGRDLRYCTCTFRWNILGWGKALVLWSFVLSSALGVQRFAIEVGLGGLLPGEEVVTKESFISICWRLIPYWLNNWEQQWGAECSSMTFELPHFAMELLVILPCVQVLCSRLKILATPLVNVAAPMPGQEPEEFVRDHYAPNILKGYWEYDPSQRRFLSRLRFNTRIMFFTLVITLLAAFNALCVPLLLEHQISFHPSTLPVKLAGSNLAVTNVTSGLYFDGLTIHLPMNLTPYLEQRPTTHLPDNLTAQLPQNATMHLLENITSQFHEPKNMDPLMSAIEASELLLSPSEGIYQQLSKEQQELLVFRLHRYSSAQGPQPFPEGALEGQTCAGVNALADNLRKHAAEITKMNDVEHRMLIPLVESALAIMRLSCEKYFVLLSVFVSYILFRDPPAAARIIIRINSRLSTLFQKVILYSFPAVCWIYGAGFIFSTFVSVVFWGGPIIGFYESLRSAISIVRIKALHAATPAEIERMGGSCAICWGDMTVGPSERGTISLPRQATATEVAGPTPVSREAPSAEAPIVEADSNAIAAVGAATEGRASLGLGIAPLLNGLRRSDAEATVLGSVHLEQSQEAVAQVDSDEAGPYVSPFEAPAGTASAGGAAAGQQAEQRSDGSLHYRVVQAVQEGRSSPQASSRADPAASSIAAGSVVEPRWTATEGTAAGGAGGSAPAHAAVKTAQAATGGAAPNLGQTLSTAASTASTSARGSAQGFSLPCGHAYHNTCLTQWLHQCHAQSVLPTCPMCQVDIQLEVKWRFPYPWRLPVDQVVVDNQGEALAGQQAERDAARGHRRLNRPRMHLQAGLQIIGMLEHQRELQELLLDMPHIPGAQDLFMNPEDVDNDGDNLAGGFGDGINNGIDIANFDDVDVIPNGAPEDLPVMGGLAEQNLEGPGDLAAARDAVQQADTTVGGSGEAEGEVSPSEAAPAAARTPLSNPGTAEEGPSASTQQNANLEDLLAQKQRLQQCLDQQRETLRQIQDAQRAAVREERELQQQHKHLVHRLKKLQGKGGSGAVGTSVSCGSEAAAVPGRAGGSLATMGMTPAAAAAAAARMRAEKAQNAPLVADSGSDISIHSRNDTAPSDTRLADVGSCSARSGSSLDCMLVVREPQVGRLGSESSQQGGELSALRVSFEASSTHPASQAVSSSAQNAAWETWKKGELDGVGGSLATGSGTSSNSQSQSRRRKFLVFKRKQ